MPTAKRCAGRPAESRGSCSGRGAWRIDNYSWSRRSALGPSGLRFAPHGDPRLRDEKLLVERDGEAVGHAGEKVSRGGVDPFRFDDPPLEELVGPGAQFVPQTPADPRGFAELRRRDLVLVED